MRVLLSLPRGPVARPCALFACGVSRHTRAHPSGNYVLTYLARKGASLESYVITALIQMLCRITKLGWFDSSGALRKIVEQATTFLQESVQHCIIGLRLLNELVMEFNHVSAKRTVSAHRKVAVSFRDLSLFYVFEICALPPPPPPSCVTRRQAAPPR